ncbi:MAG: type II secretion protein F [Alphaproteobacteria bacterium]|nr:MAG: type II secretion protein F [Alphaproteobacteria bacterium]
MQALLTAFDPLMLASAFGALLVFGLLFYLMQERGEARSRSDLRKRLDISAPARPAAADGEPPPDRSAARRAAGKFARRTNDFYASSDPKSLRAMQMQLIQAGYLHPQALGYFIASRIVLALALGLLVAIAVLLALPHWVLTTKLMAILMAATIGYFVPNFLVGRRIKQLRQLNRAGFPDVMDLMIVAAEAGLTMEASIERIAHEIERTYPALSRQLAIAALEIRAGRPLDQALRAFGERLGLEEVQGFATMIQQSKELGTSIADALRVYSDEMRHKRMMAAEEKAYALPAKLSIPVTAFILPIVIGIAVLPTVVRLMNQ